MIYKENGKYKIACDGCEEVVKISFDTFKEAVAYAKKHNWLFDKNKKGWINICPECNS